MVAAEEKSYGNEKTINNRMKIYFINPPFKAEYGKFSRESRSPAIAKSGVLYYPFIIGKTKCTIFQNEMYQK